MKTVQTLYGVFTLLNNDPDASIISQNKIPNQVIIDEFVTKYVQSSSAIVHLGSGNGVLDVYFCRANPSISIYSFEPREACFYVIGKNLQDNQIENVMLMNNALGHMVGPMTVSGTDTLQCDHDDIIELGNGKLVGFNNQFVFLTLDSLNLLACHIILISLQGYEYITIAGSMQTIKKFKPVIFFRHDEQKNKHVHDMFGIHNRSVLDLLKKLEYSIEYIRDGYVLATPLVESDQQQVDMIHM